MQEGTIYLSCEMAYRDSEEHFLYIIQHEWTHWLLESMFGRYTSAQLDTLHRRPLTCLRGHTIETFLTNMMRPSDG